MIIANMATYPARVDTIKKTVPIIAKQVDVLYICLNEFSEIPEFLSEYKNIKAFIPKQDYKDVGKFVTKMKDNDDIFYVDDDIIYPSNYVKRTIEIREEFDHIKPIIGYHGIIYSDVFDGSSGQRNVFSFKFGLNQHRLVNQLGTGTIHCKGWQCPTLEYMNNSQKYVDVRFARHAFAYGYPMICGSRSQGWMQEVHTDETIFEGFTKKWPIPVTREVQEIAGYSKLDFHHLKSVETV